MKMKKVISLIIKPINLLGSLFRRKTKTDGSQPDTTHENSCDGRIIIEYNSKKGNFTVNSEVYNLSDESVEGLALLIFQITEGNINSLLYESLRLWADNDKKKLEFNSALADYIIYLDSLLIETKEDVAKDKVAVRASKVFNLREMQ